MGAYLYMLIYECMCILYFTFLAAMKNIQQDVKELNVYFASQFIGIFIIMRKS